MASISDSTSGRPPASTVPASPAPTTRAPTASADLQKQSSAFRGLLTAPATSTAGEEGEEEPGTAMPGAVLASPQQALAWAGLAQRQPGQQQGALQPWAGVAESSADPLHADLLSATQGMSVSGFALWRRLQDQHPGGQGDAGAALQPAQLAMSDAAANTAAPASADPEGAFAALVEKHVRQMLVSLPTLGERGGAVQIRLSDTVLPDTSLSLSRTDSGWRLQAHSGDSASAQALRQFAPALVARFAQQRLGALEVEVAA